MQQKEGGLILSAALNCGISVLLRARAYRRRWIRLMPTRILHHLITLGAKLEKRLRLDIKPRNIAIHDCFPNHASSSLRSEIILVVEAMHHLEYVIGGQTWVLDVGHLVAALVAHRRRILDESILPCVFIELSTRIRVGNRSLDRFHVERLRELDRV